MMDDQMHIKEENFDNQHNFRTVNIEIKEETELDSIENKVKVKQEIEGSNVNFVGVCEIKTEKDDSVCEDFDDPLKDYSVHEENEYEQMVDLIGDKKTKQYYKCESKYAVCDEMQIIFSSLCCFRTLTS